MRLLNVHFIALVGLIARLTVAFLSERIDHPDEIFQYLEQAHRLAFGYGYIPWEYRFGTRSWILPGFVSGILYLCKSLGADDPAIYTRVVQVVFCTLSVSLIYSAYLGAREIGGETAGRLAALFTSLWYELVYFAHKPNPEILSAYLIAAALALVLRDAHKPNPPLVGIFSAAAVALRVQYLPAVAVLAFLGRVRWRTQAIATAALSVVATVAAVDDKFTPTIKKKL
jgi:hypothetical protein